MKTRIVLLLLLATAVMQAAEPIKGGKDDILSKFYGLPVVETNTVFLLDFSGSMRGERIQRLRKEFASVLDSMSESRRFGIVLFSGIGTLRFPLKGLARPTEKEKKAALKFIKRPPSGQTPMMSAFDSAFSRLVKKEAKLEERADAIYVLSDGAPTDADPDEVLKAVDRMNTGTLVVIHTISIGEDSEMLEELAARNSGKYKKIEAKPPQELRQGQWLRKKK